MIFDDGFDRTLWLLLEKDIDNRTRIVDFIRSIPRELLINIQNSLIKYNNMTDKKEIYGDDYTRKNYIYYFNISDGVLHLGRCAYRYGLYYTDFELRLRSFKDIKEIEMFNDGFVGEMSYDFKQVSSGNMFVLGDSKDVVYRIMRYPFCDVLRVSNNSEIFGTKYRNVNLDERVNDYNLEDIRTDKLFVKKRSRKKRG